MVRHKNNNESRVVTSRVKHLFGRRLTCVDALSCQLGKFTPSVVCLFRDDTPHVPNEDLGEEAVLYIVSNLTHIINQVFPSQVHHMHISFN